MVFYFLLYLGFTLYDLILPVLTLKSRKKEELKKLKKMGMLDEDTTTLNYSFIELQVKMLEYGGYEEMMDYMDIVNVFGFVLLFGITLPLGALLAMIYIGLQIRVDAWKLTKYMRRPFPRRAVVWTWQGIVDQLMYLGMVTNIGLICYYHEPFRSM